MVKNLAARGTRPVRRQGRGAVPGAAPGSAGARALRGPSRALPAPPPWGPGQLAEVDRLRNVSGFTPRACCAGPLRPNGPRSVAEVGP